jgi:predicted AlkP superfamily pyrophosphatase or phosphodiesterase
VKFLPFWLTIALAAACMVPVVYGAPAAGDGLLVISIDGLNPAYVIEADRFRLKVPNLRRILQTGAYAKGVRGVLPTVTYPTHTTMLTGVFPAKHGIYSNVSFDPEIKNTGGWYWYSEDVRVPTIWTAAADAGYTVGSVAWPVSVSAKGVRFLIPEYWRSMKGADDLKVVRALSSPGLLSELEKKHGKYVIDLDNATPGDWMRTRYAASIIRDKGAQLLTIHLASLDHIEHETGPASNAGFAALEEIDSMVGELETAIRAVAPNAVVCVLSDHGMTRVDHQVNLNAAFVKAGLITLSTQPGASGTAGISDWKAQAWLSGGSAAIMLKSPDDESTARTVKQLLDGLAADSANGIAEVMDRQAIAKAGGAPTASFWVDFKPGFSSGAALSGEVTRSVSARGTHGYAPSHDDMQASFFIAGPRIRPGLIAANVEMRHVAPTLAQTLGLSFPGADLRPLDIFEARKER